MVEPAPIFWRDVGHASPRGTTAVWMLIHGDFSDGPGTWSDQMRAAGPGHRLLILDRRGCGQSPRGPVPYTIGGDAEDALEVAERAGVPSFHLMGHSYGALVAIEMVRRRPRAVASLHLIEPPYMSLLPHDPDVAALRRQAEDILRQARDWDSERLATAFFAMLGGPGWVEHLKTTPAWPHIVREARRAVDQQLAASYPPEALTVLTGSPGPWGSPDGSPQRGAPAWRGPVRIYTGGRSHPALRKLAYHLASLIPGARLVDIPEATHAVQRAGEPFQRAMLEGLQEPA